MFNVTLNFRGRCKGKEEPRAVIARKILPELKAYRKDVTNAPPRMGMAEWKEQLDRMIWSLGEVAGGFSGFPAAKGGTDGRPGLRKETGAYWRKVGLGLKALGTGFLDLRR